jgi:cardiolipin synthase
MTNIAAISSHWIGLYLVYVIVGWGIRLAMVPIVLRRQMTPGASLAWLGIAALHPYVGLTLYLLVGESRLGPRRAQRHRDIVDKSRDPAGKESRRPHETEPIVPEPYRPMVLQSLKIAGLPCLSGNGVEFLSDQPEFLDRLVVDISKARHHVHLLYYIFADDATAHRVADVLLAAKARGVECRVLADALASREFLGRRGLGRKLSSAGVVVQAALQLTPLRRHLARMDLRNHRKLAVIDDAIAYAGSHNLINADYAGGHGGPWYDITARFDGPIVGELASVFAEDWEFETGEQLAFDTPAARPPDSPDSASPNAGPAGRIANVVALVVPTGPSRPDANYRKLLLAAIQSARRELVITTPYFVPDESALLALQMAADRGVNVKLILPRVADHFFAAAAGRAHYELLLRSGVEIYLYEPGLLHAKTTTVDHALALFGSANLDVRSFRLNFELSIMMYDGPAATRLRELQQAYLAQSERLDLDAWCKRSYLKQFADQAVSLLSPLL